MAKTFAGIGSKAKGASVGATVIGLEALAAKMSFAPVRAANALRFGMDKEMTHVIEDARHNFTPVDTGALMDSTRVVSVIKGHDIKVTGGFGPALAERRRRLGSIHASGSEYALPVHALHPTMSRYLQIPWELHQEHMLKVISQEAWRRF